MLSKASAINGYAIKASDGSIGTVSDFLFDDLSWRIRWLVVHTGSWLSGRKVLLPPSVLGHTDPDTRAFSVKLTRQQVNDSPDIATDQPVSRQLETNIFDYYGWTPYWSTGFYMGGYSYLNQAMAPAPYLGSRKSEDVVAEALPHSGNPDLRSIEEVTKYHIHAGDGEIGHVADFLLEEADWSIRFLIVDTTNWWPGKKVLISPRSVAEVDWADSLVNLRVDRQHIKDSPAYDPSTVIDRAFEAQFHRHDDGRLSGGTPPLTAGPRRGGDGQSAQLG